MFDKCTFPSLQVQLQLEKKNEYNNQVIDGDWITIYLPRHNENYIVTHAIHINQQTEAVNG